MFPDINDIEEEISNLKPVQRDIFLRSMKWNQTDETIAAHYGFPERVVKKIIGSTVEQVLWDYTIRKQAAP